MNFYGIFGCVVLLVVIPAAACFNEHYVRAAMTRRPEMESSSTAYHVTLARNIPKVLREGSHPRRGPPLPEAGWLQEPHQLPSYP